PVPDVMHATWDAGSGYSWGERIAAREDVTAVLCGNDEIAIGLMRALADRHVRVPEEVSVIGFDDQPLVSMWQPSLTTIDQDFEDLGARAFRLLGELVSGQEAAEDSVTTPALVVRESTAPPGREHHRQPIDLTPGGRSEPPDRSAHHAPGQPGPPPLRRAALPTSCPRRRAAPRR